MSTQGWIISLLGVLIGLVWIIVPLFRQKAALPDETLLLQKQKEHLLVFYEQVLRTIRDLDEDYKTGKLNKDSYEVSREQWMQRGTQILAALEEMPTLDLSRQRMSEGNDLEQQIEAEIAQYLATKAGNASL